jgi:ankyrin repeat protein
LQDRDGMSALMVASFRGSVHVVKVLLGEEGCDPDLVSRDGKTAHSLALSYGHKTIARILWEGLDNPDEVRRVALYDDVNF